MMKTGQGQSKSTIKRRGLLRPLATLFIVALFSLPSCSIDNSLSGFLEESPSLGEDSLLVDDGAEKLMGGDIVVVSWPSDSSQPSTLSIQVSSDDGQNWSLVKSKVTNNGSYSWTVPKEDGISYRLRLFHPEENWVLGVSDLFSIDSTAPVAPSSLTLQSPSSSPGSDSTPTIAVSPVESGSVVRLFSDSSCTTEIGQASASSSSVNVTSDPLSDASYTIFGLVEDEVGNQSSCSSASVTYELDSVAPTATLSGAPLDPSNDTLLSVDVGGADVVNYSFKVGVSGSTDCSVSDGYSDLVAATTDITSDISALSDGSLTLCVVGEDSAGNTQAYSSATSYSWTKDATQPTPTISSTEPGVTNTSPIPVVIDFTENVSGFTLSDLTVTNGTAGNFASVTGSQYTADITPSADGTVSVDVAAGVAQDSVTNHNVAATQFSITYDSSAPTATLSGAPADPSNDTALNVNVGGADVVSYYYKVGVASSTDCSAGSGYSAQVSESANITDDISALADGSLRLCVVGEDSAGNTQAYSSATSHNWTKDTSQPTVTISSTESGTTGVSPIPVTIDFSESVTGFVVGDITVTNGTAGNFASVTGSQYTADITPSADGTVSVDVAASVAQDAASNNNTAATQFSLTYDSSAPTATLASTPSDPSNVTALNVDVAGTDVVAYYYKVGVSGSTDCTSSTGYSSQVAESTNITEDISALSDGSITICVIGENSAGNTQSYASATSYSWTKDTSPPTVTISSNESDPTNNSPFSVTIDFSENVTDFVVGDMTVTNGTAGIFVSVTGSQYTADITPSADGTVSVDVAASVAQDSAGNNNTAATQFSITYDTTAPTATLASTPSDPSNVTVLNVDVAGTDVVAYYYKVGVTGSTDCTVSTGYSAQVAEATNITDDISALSDGSITICAVGEDSAGNAQAHASATSYTWTKDTAQPSVTISSSESGSTSTSPIPITIDFSESVTGFAVGDITVTNGSAGNFVSVSGSQYTADITPSADGTVSVDVATGVAQDSAGNNNTAAPQFSITYDTTAPTATLAGTPSDPSNVTSLNVDVAGTDVVAYYYKVGVTSSTDCTASSGYSAQVAESTNITDDISALADGSITICAVGEDSAGNIQAYASATSYSWTKDTAQPSVTISSSESSPTNANPIPVTIDFSESVTGFAVGDITVTNGSAGNFVSVSGSQYTADITPSAEGTVSVDVAAGVAQDSAGNNNTAATQFSLTYDGTAPTATLAGTPADPNSTTTLNVDVAGTDVVAYYYKVGVTSSTDCTSSAGYSSQVAEATNITDDISALSDGSITICAIGEDSAGNIQAYASATSYSWTKDTTQPTVTITSSESDPTNANPIPITIDFSESVTGFAVGDITVTNGSAGNFVSVSGSQYTADITPSAEGTVSVDVASGVAQDAAGNNNTAATQFSITYDSTAPTATLAGTPADPSNVTVLNVDVAGTDVVAYYYKVGVTSSTDCTSSTGYSSQVAEATNITDDISALSDGSITICAIGEDSAGNAQAYASPTSYSWTKDTTQPTVTITSSESDPTNASPIPITIDFSESVTGFAVGDIAVTNGSAGNFVTVSGSQYTADITPSAEGTVSVDVASGVAQDSAGNNNTAATQFNITYDTTAPTATLAGTPSDPSNVTSLNVDVGGLGVVAYYYKHDASGSIDCTSSLGYSSKTGEITNITDDISALADGSITICVVGEDSAGNIQAYASATSYSWTKDTAQPSVTISSSESSPTNANPIPITIDFSESVTGFAVGDITVTNGSAGNFVSVSGSQYTADITPSADGTVSVDVASGVAQDSAGNGNTAATQFSITYDSTAPTATLAGTPSDPSNVTSLNVDVAGTDVVAYYYKVGVTSSTDCTSSTGYSTQVAEATNITNDISALSDGSITICAIGEDSVGNIQAYASATSYSWTKDTAQPSVTITSTESGATNSSPFAITIDFSESVTGFVVGDIAVTNGSAGNFVSVSGSQYTADITPSAEGTVSVDIAASVAQDGASNNNTAATQFSITYDSTAPTGITVDDKLYMASLSSTPSISWTASSDSGSGIDHYEYALGTSAGATDVLDWTSNGTSTSVTHTGLSLTTNTTYYASARAVDAAGNTASAQGDGWIADTSVPSTPGSPALDSTISSLTETPVISWSASSDPAGGSGLSHYEVQIHNTSDDTVHTAWFTHTSGQAKTGITLADQSRYYVKIRAVDNAGNNSLVAQTSSWTAKAVTENFIQVVTGGHHSCGLMSDGTTYCWGRNNYGQLGIGTITDNTSPVEVNLSNLATGTSFIQISAGEYHNCGLASDGQSYCWGHDNAGQLGDGGTATDQSIPVLVDTSALTSGTNFTLVKAGGFHSCALTSDGKAYCWGDVSNGRLGTGGAVSSNQQSPVAVDLSNLTAGTSLVQLMSGKYHNCGVANDGKAFCWGRDNYGQIGDGGANADQNKPVLVDSTNLTSGSSFVIAMAGEYHSCGIASDGKGYCWGRDTYGQVGDGGATDGDLTTPAPLDTTNLTPDTKFKDIMAGGYHSCGLTSDGKVYCWGTDGDGRLGDGGGASSQGSPVAVDTTNLSAGSSFSQLVVGAYHACAMAGADGKTFCWGRNTYGQIGVGNTTHQYSPVAIDTSPVKSEIGFIQVDGGLHHSCGLRSEGVASCWGRNDTGQLGNGGTGTNQAAPVMVDTTNLTAGTQFVQLTANGHSCGLASDGKAYCWGDDTYGELGNGGTNTAQGIPVGVDTTNLTTGTSFIQIDAGKDHTCGLASDGKAFCWGYDLYGQLGDGGTNTDKTIPVVVDTSNLTAGSSFVFISTGDNHTCGLASDGKAYCWGYAGNGQLGDGGATNQAIPVAVDMTNVSAGSGFINISSGAEHTCAVTDDRDAFCWGYDNTGQLGDGGTNTTQSIPVLVDTTNLAAGTTFLQVTAAQTSSCGIANNGQAYCWGDDTNGELGDGGTAANQAIPVLVSSGNLSTGETFTSITSGGLHHCSYSSQGLAYCWGDDAFGQVGDGGSSADQTIPTLVDTGAI